MNLSEFSLRTPVSERAPSSGVLPALGDEARSETRARALSARYIEGAEMTTLVMKFGGTSVGSAAWFP
jgi:hypothetical protein